jgi:translation initiation factor IF-3
MARQLDLDLVEVAPSANPPVCRIMDYGKFRYEESQKAKESRKKTIQVSIKEVKFRPKIGKGDFDTKVRRAIEFLEDGDRVKVTVQFRGREVSHAYLGRELLIRFAEQVGEHGAVERQPLLEGKQMSLVMTSTHKPKIQKRDDEEQTEGAAAADEALAPAASAAPPTPVAATKPAPAPSTVAKSAGA